MAIPKDLPGEVPTTAKEWIDFLSDDPLPPTTRGRPTPKTRTGAKKR